MKPGIRLSDVARESGVSSATASRALNEKAGVDPEVRDRVQAVAKKLGYRPNRAAKTLAGGPNSVIALVLGNKELLFNSYATSVLTGVSEAAELQDQGLMLMLHSRRPQSTLHHMFADGIVDGAIVSAAALGTPWVEELLDTDVPLILIGAHPDRPELPFVDVDNQAAGYEITKHLLDHGHERIGMITGPMSRADTQARIAGFRQAHGERDVVPDPSLCAKGTYKWESGYEAADCLLPQEPDAVFALNDEMAFGFMRRCRELGFDVPGDISLAGFDATPSDDPGAARLTTMSRPFEQIADVAVRSLLHLIEGKPVPHQQLVASQVLSPGGGSVREAARPRRLSIQQR